MSIKMTTMTKRMTKKTMTKMKKMKMRKALTMTMTMTMRAKTEITLAKNLQVRVSPAINHPEEVRVTALGRLILVRFQRKFE
jgi:hypothetical protein